MEKLYIEKMGCDFFIGDPIEKVSDMINHRYYIKGVTLKDGRTVDTIEISSGVRYKLNSKGILQKVDNFKLWVSSYYYDENGNCSRIKEIDDKFNSYDLTYTQKNVLYFINQISKKQYDVIEKAERY